MKPKLDPNDSLTLRRSLPIVGRLRPRMVIFAVVLVVAAVCMSFILGIRSSSDRHASGRWRDLIGSQTPSSVQALPQNYSEVETPQPEQVTFTPQPVAEPAFDSELAKALLEEAESARMSPIFFASAGSADNTLSIPANSPEQNDQSPETFASSLNGITPFLDQPYRQPSSRFVITAGTFIPATLVTAINSDLPGDIVARVSEPVFDSITGRYMLIPSGAVLYGSYRDTVENGHERILVVWQRLIMGNGRSIELGAMAGVDAQGVAGIAGKVDNHVDKLIGGVLLSTILSFGGNLARSPDSSRDHSDVIGDTVAQEASRVGQRIVDRHLNVKPTIKVPQGTTVNVLVNKDIVLEPYGALP